MTTAEKVWLTISILFAIGVFVAYVRDKHFRCGEPPVLEVLPMAIAPCQKCGYELWLSGRHSSDHCEHAPILHDEEGWWFYDETRSFLYGPYQSHQTVVDAFVMYRGELFGTELGE